MKALGFDPSKEELNAILNEHGSLSGHRRLIDEAAFTAVMTPRIANRDPAIEIDKAFGLFTGGREVGGITVDDLRRVTRELQEGLEEEDLKAMIDEFDLDGDGESKFCLHSLLFFQSLVG